MTSLPRPPSIAVSLHPYRYLDQLPERDGSEVEEWADSVDALVDAAGAEPALRDLVTDLGDDDLRRLRRGGHDPRKVHAAYRAAIDHRGAPRVILARPSRAGWARISRPRRPRLGDRKAVPRGVLAEPLPPGGRRSGQLAGRNARATIHAWATVRPARCNTPRADGADTLASSRVPATTLTAAAPRVRLATTGRRVSAAYAAPAATAWGTPPTLEPSGVTAIPRVASAVAPPIRRVAAERNVEDHAPMPPARASIPAVIATRSGAPTAARRLMGSATAEYPSPRRRPSTAQAVMNATGPRIPPRRRTPTCRRPSATLTPSSVVASRPVRPAGRSRPGRRFGPGSAAPPRRGTGT